MKNSLDSSLAKSIAVESLSDLLGSVSETALDAVLENGLLRDIPIINSITGLIKAGRDISTALFVRKILLFLQTISEIPYQKRIEFINQYESSEKQHKFGEAILLLLEQVENMEKPKLMARIMNAHILKKIDEDTALRICSMIKRCYVSDLKYLINFTDGVQYENDHIAEALATVGFLSYGGDHIKHGKNRMGIYFLNQWGSIIVEHALTKG